MRNRKYISIAIAICILSVSVLAYADTKDKTTGTVTLPEHYYTECPQQGTYKVFYDEKGAQNVNVYFPYGYSDSKYSKYDVFMMLHQAGNGNMSSWIETPCQSYGGILPPKQVYDWLIYEKRIPQILVVCVNLELNEDNRDEIRNAMHWAGDNLRTYAKNGTDEELAKARAHFYVGGLSMGAWKTDKCMREDYDIFGNYIIGYGGAVNYTARTIGDAYMKDNAGKWFIKNLIIGCGDKDVAYENLQENLRILSPVSERHHFFRYFGGHGWSAAIPMIYDALTFIYDGYSELASSCVSQTVSSMKTSLFTSSLTS